MELSVVLLYRIATN